MTDSNLRVKSVNLEDTKKVDKNAEQVNSKLSEDYGDIVDDEYGLDRVRLSVSNFADKPSRRNSELPSRHTTVRRNSEMPLRRNSELPSRGSPVKATRSSPVKATRSSPGKATRSSPGKATRSSPGKATRGSHKRPSVLSRLSRTVGSLFKKGGKHRKSKSRSKN
jgi:hypothetical protein